MSQIKLIEKDTDIESLSMFKFSWDVVLNGVPYQVVQIEGYVHSIGGRWGENDLWMYPRNETPSYENIIEYQCEGSGVCWGIRYDPHNYIRTKYGESECFTSGGAMITRNGKDFHFCRGGIDEAKWLIKKIDDHPLDLNDYGFDEEMIGKKVWWRSQPAIITKWIGDGEACVILEPDTDIIKGFTIPQEFVEDEDYDPDDKEYIKTSIFDDHIWWFRV